MLKMNFIARLYPAALMSIAIVVLSAAGCDSEKTASSQSAIPEYQRDAVNKAKDVEGVLKDAEQTREQQLE